MPDSPDFRDHPFVAKATRPTGPLSIDLRAQCAPIYDQGQLGSCVANATAGAVQFARRAQGLTPHFRPSRLFIYYFGRVLEGTVNIDSGMSVRDGFKVLATKGAPPETDWPYHIANFRQEPPAIASADGLQDLALEYLSVPQTIVDIQSALVDRKPVTFGFTVYDSFESAEVASTGVVPMPQAGERALGGHCVDIVGCDDASERFIVRNSWGTGWGMAGYCTMPYAYIENPRLASSFWAVEMMA